jgi:natural product biosynthesis luciferase-like monooxygenase protein
MGVSVETVIAGARAMELMRERECGEICLDVTADKRPQALQGSERILGLLSNVLPLPITAPGEKSLSEWLQELERKRTKLQRYGHVSRSQIKRWLGLSDGEQLFDSYMPARIEPSPLPEPDQELEFSLFYFADDNAVYGEDKYRLYREGAMFADRNHLTAVWTPERHFHEKAGLYPNPSVLSAALATITRNVQLRAGSVVLPLHNSLRVAEEWSVVDNLSRGRVGVSFTSGWMPNDFAFFPERYATKRDEMFRGIEEVQQLWRGEPIPGRDGVGKEIELRIFPKPIQPELPIWLTCSGGPEMFEKAGELGCHVLTALLTQSIEEVTPKIQLYRDALVRHGHDPSSRKVTMMMHTFIGEDPDAVLQTVRAPLTKYLKSHLNLIETGAESLNLAVDVRDQDPEKVRDQMAAFAFQRYYRTSSLIGTPMSCMKMVERLKAIGVDEVACLIDFGIDVDSVLESLEHLAVLRDLSNAAQPEAALLATTAASV